MRTNPLSGRLSSVVSLHRFDVADFQKGRRLFSGQADHNRLVLKKLVGKYARYASPVLHGYDNRLVVKRIIFIVEGSADGISAVT